MPFCGHGWLWVFVLVYLFEDYGAAGACEVSVYVNFGVVFSGFEGSVFGEVNALVEFLVVVVDVLTCAVGHGLAAGLECLGVVGGAFVVGVHDADEECFCAFVNYEVVFYGEADFDFLC